MAAQAEEMEWSVTDAKVDEALRRIVAAGDPLQIIAFGSRARGDHKPESDLDLAVILDCAEEETRKRVDYLTLRGLRMPVDLIVVSKAKFDLHRPWINSVFNYIDEEGVILYDREDPQSARRDALWTGNRGRSSASISAA